MGNLSIGIKKILSNKNTVTVIGVIAAVLVLYLGYNWRVNSQIELVPVPYARRTITPGDQITSDMIGERRVPRATIDESTMLVRRSDIIDRFASIDSVIPEGSLFFRRSVVEIGDNPDSITFDIPAGHRLFSLDVNMERTMGNAIVPGNYIDIEFRASMRSTGEGDLTTIELNALMVGMLLENVRVIAVRDSAGRDVFANRDEGRVPSMVIFSVPSDYYFLLRKAQNLRQFDSVLTPNPTANQLADQPDTIRIGSQDIVDFIDRVTVFTEQF